MVPVLELQEPTPPPTINEDTAKKTTHQSIAVKDFSSPPKHSDQVLRKKLRTYGSSTASTEEPAVVVYARSEAAARKSISEMRTPPVVRKAALLTDKKGRDKICANQLTHNMARCKKNPSECYRRQPYLVP